MSCLLKIAAHEKILNPGFAERLYLLLITSFIGGTYHNILGGIRDKVSFLIK